VKGAECFVHQPLLKSVQGRSFLMVFDISRRQILPRENKSVNHRSHLFLLAPFYLAFVGWHVRCYLCPYGLVFCHHRTKFQISWWRQGSMFSSVESHSCFWTGGSFPAFSMSRAGRLAHFPHERNMIAILLACFQFSYKMSTEELIVWLH